MADQDGDGLIDYEEFVAMMTAGDKPDKNAMKNAKWLATHFLRNEWWSRICKERKGTTS